MTKFRRIAVTMGDPEGIGPEIAVKALLKAPPGPRERIVLIGYRPAFAGLPGFRKLLNNGRIQFVDVGSDVTILDPASSGKLAYRSLRAAVDLIRAGEAHALVTAPISKERIAKAGFRFPGHTEYLCHAFGVKRFAMMLFHSRLRVVLSTIHEPLRRVPDLLTRRNVAEKLELTASSLRANFGIARPRIAVCGLNPHAGENGLIGDEENETIRPAMRAFQRKAAFSHVTVSGPHPADTVFHDALSGRYDAVLCHYHDQALIPLKTTGFDEGVNMTLGLPFTRTSPDHGTAFDIAGRGIANPKSMIMALKFARHAFV